MTRTGKRTLSASGPASTGQPAAPLAKRLRPTPNEDGSASGDVDLLQGLPPELVFIVLGNLAPRECQALRLTCKSLRDLVNVAVADTLTVTNDMAQYLLLEQMKHSRAQSHALSNGWVANLLAKFPRIKKLDVKCTQGVLTLFARHMVRDCLGSQPPGGVPLSRIFDLADNVKTNSRRHSAVLLCELIKFKVAQSLTSKPPGYDAMRQDVKQYVRADQLLTEHRIELQTRVIELVEKVLTLKGHADARAHEHFKYARDTLDDSLLQLVSCLQPRHSKYAYQLLAKAADPAKAARGWRWLFYFLARQKQAEAAIEAYKVVDKPALAALSPTCLSELFRSLIDNEITTQPEPKLRAITSESGSWTKFLYRGNFQLTSTQSREGALEKVAADLVGKDYLDTAVNVMNRFESEGTALEIWVQLLGALGIVPGGEVPLVARDLHRFVSEQVHKAALLALNVLPARRVACHVPLVELLVAEGHLEEAFSLTRNYPEEGVLDKHLLRALSTSFALADCPPGQLAPATCELLLDVLQNRITDVAARSELTTILVAAYAARRDLLKAVELASTLDAAAAAAMDVDAGAGGGPAVEPVPAAAAQNLGPVLPAPGPGDGAGPAAPAADAAAAPDAAGTAGQRLAAMWRGVAAAAIWAGDAKALLTALQRVNTAWLLGPADADCGPDDAGASTSGGDASRAAGGAGPSRAGGAGSVPPGEAPAPAEAGAAGPAANASGGGAAGQGAAQSAAGSASGPPTVWQRVCGVLLRAGHRSDLEKVLMRLLTERQRALGGHTDQRALVEATARAMVSNGDSVAALALARQLGGHYCLSDAPTLVACGTAGSPAAAARADSPGPTSAGEDGASGKRAAGAGVRPCWSMLNVILEGLMAGGQVDTVVRELLAAGAAQSKASAHSAGAGPGGATSGGSAAGGTSGDSALVLSAAAGRLRQSLLADVLSTLTEAGRVAEAVHLLRVLRGGENDGPLQPPPPLINSAAALPPVVQRTGSGAGRVTRAGRAGGGGKRNRSSAAAAAVAAAAAAAGARAGAGPGAAAAAEAYFDDIAATIAAVVMPGAMMLEGQASVTSNPGPSTAAVAEQGNGPQPMYSRLVLEGSGDEAAGSPATPLAAGPPGVPGRPPAGPGPCRATSFEAALAALVKALHKRAGTGTNNSGSAAASGSSAGAAGSAGGGAGGAASGPPPVELLSDWLEVCKAWPPGTTRDAQLDALARRAMDKGRDIDVALQAGWLLGEANPQEMRFAYTHRDLAQKCIQQGMLEAAQWCLMRIKLQNWDDAGDAMARDLMRAVARTGDKPLAMQLAAMWITTDDQRADFIKTIRAIRPTAGANSTGGGGGSRAGSSSRGSSRD
ncbi:hypothetical protein HYH03_001332 [Edaphochlamys debaryana]|uniref:F-box domain-containing protein n=1 Tax=Edaphochlamys debaryana TaxID=47281 RepID=A0A836C4V0_9CHLO|nr:hypothetical protein HYH03_001332 [Edaphochlamys debaryana]|eukprot:KAG2500561.1 hypothetical protein HYH03_001332 [Edaphochlamys debaryana]